MGPMSNGLQGPTSGCTLVEVLLEERQRTAVSAVQRTERCRGGGILTPAGRVPHEPVGMTYWMPPFHALPACLPAVPRPPPSPSS